MKKTILIFFMILSNFIIADIRDDVKNNNLEAVKSYVQRVSPKYEINEFLADAVYYGYTDMEKYLLEKGANYNEALIRATSGSRDNEKLKKLLKKDANPNYRDDLGYTALHMASQDNKIEFVKLILKYGGNPNIKNNDGKTSYDLAAERGYTELLKELPKPHGFAILRSMMHNTKNWFSSYYNWIPKELNDTYYISSLLNPILFIFIFSINLLVKIGLPIGIVIYFLKKSKKPQKNKEEKKV